MCAAGNIIAIRAAERHVPDALQSQTTVVTNGPGIAEVGVVVEEKVTRSISLGGHPAKQGKSCWTGTDSVDCLLVGCRVEDEASLKKNATE